MTMKKQIGQVQNEMNMADPPSRADNIGKIILYIALVILSIAVGVFLYWIFQPDDVLEVKNSPVPVRTIGAIEGADGAIILNVDFCKKIGVEGIVRISFVTSSRETFLPVSIDKQGANCTQTEVPILIPKDLPSGKYKIHFRIDYQVNPIKKAVEEFDSREFEITSKSELNEPPTVQGIEGELSR